MRTFRKRRRNNRTLSHFLSYPASAPASYSSRNGPSNQPRGTALDRGPQTSSSPSSLSAHNRASPHSQSSRHSNPNSPTPCAKHQSPTLQRRQNRSSAAR